MMREDGITDMDVTVQVDVQVELYLKHRIDPVNLSTTFVLKAEHLIEADEPVEAFMGIVLSTFLDRWNDRDGRYFLLSDSNWNRSIVLTDEVQGVSLLTPIIEIQKKLEELSE